MRYVRKRSGLSLNMLSVDHLNAKTFSLPLIKMIKGRVRGGKNYEGENIDDILFGVFSDVGKEGKQKKSAVKNSILGIIGGIAIGGAIALGLAIYSERLEKIKKAEIFHPTKDHYIKQQYSNAHNKSDRYPVEKSKTEQKTGEIQILRTEPEQNPEKIKKYYDVVENKTRENEDFVPLEHNITIPFVINETQNPERITGNNQPNRETIDAKKTDETQKPYDTKNKEEKIAHAIIPPIPRTKPRRNIPNLISVKPGYYRTSIGIRDSLYYTARENGLPDPVIAEMIRLHSFEVDFQREIHNGDIMEVFYYSPKEHKTQAPVLIYTSLDLKGGKSVFYRFTNPENGKTSYYDENGQGASRTFIRTPIDGARISSKFGIRKHPILGYNKMHSGVDFAAPTGTPVKAAADGTIDMVQRYGAYGNYVRIKHAKGQATAYAHLSKYAKGLKKGQKVKQGQIIAYVGSTGRSTGPHLHYEILQDGKPVNPLSTKFVGQGEKLTGKALIAFNRHKLKIKQVLAKTPSSTRVAQK